MGIGAIHGNRDTGILEEIIYSSYRDSSQYSPTEIMDPIRIRIIWTTVFSFLHVLNIRGQYLTYTQNTFLLAPGFDSGLKFEDQNRNRQVYLLIYCITVLYIYYITYRRKGEHCSVKAEPRFWERLMLHC